MEYTIDVPIPEDKIDTGLVVVPNCRYPKYNDNEGKTFELTARVFLEK
jgi:hypothetical protein